MRRLFPMLVAAALLHPGSAQANPLKSLYTTIELKSCAVVRKQADGGAWSCRGLEGYPVQVAEGDLRTFVSVGASPAARRAASQTLGAFNSLFPPKAGASQRTTLEWRFKRLGGKAVPHATILRYFTSRDGASGQVIVVSKVTAKETCHVAYIDALANPDAIAIARRTADTAAPTFDCQNPPKVVGAAGRSPL